ncbi:MAG: crossover junction endodeoxyribonuclease RuvC [Burkholderiaceae bacterium]
MRILGIDPGLRLTGFGVIDVDGPRLSYVTSGVVRTPDGDLPQRLHVIFESIREIVALHGPTCAAIEKVFVNVNPQSTLLLGQARGAAICALMTGGITVAEYTALQTKQATVGYGKANKTQVQEMVKRLLRLSGSPTADAADALACAICHAHAGAGIAALARMAPALQSQLLLGRLKVRRGRVGGPA